MTHSMNGAVETRSNWKGLNAGLREVPSMVAIAFARGWKVKMCGTRASVRGRVIRWRVIRSPTNTNSALEPSLSPQNDCLRGASLVGTARIRAKTRVRDEFSSRNEGHPFLIRFLTELVAT